MGSAPFVVGGEAQVTRRVHFNVGTADAMARLLACILGPRGMLKSGRQLIPILVASVFDPIHQLPHAIRLPDWHWPSFVWFELELRNGFLAIPNVEFYSQSIEKSCGTRGSRVHDETSVSADSAG